MKKWSFLIIIFWGYIVPGHSHESQSASRHHDDLMEGMAMSMASSESINIAVLIYDNVVLQDLAGPIEVFSKAKKLTNNKYHVFTVAAKEAVISTEHDLVKITPDYTYATMPEIDYLIVPGASMSVINTMMKQDSLTAFINHVDDKPDTTIVTICTATYLLAKTGALDNRKATTHYFVADDFSQQFEETEVIKNVRFIDEQKYITSSGVTSGIDVALYIVGKNSGVGLRDMTSRALQYTFHEHESWPTAPNNMRYQGH